MLVELNNHIIKLVCVCVCVYVGIIPIFVTAV